jgi:hypothetical protein
MKGIRLFFFLEEFSQTYETEDGPERMKQYHIHGIEPLTFTLTPSLKLLFVEAIFKNINFLFYKRDE